MISVALAFYNGKKYINEQIYSILKNLKTDDELVISVDDDRDGSGEILAFMAQKDARIHLVKGPGKGVVANFQNALRQCRGEIIFLADQDDVWKDHKVARIEKIFEDPKVTAVVHNAEIVDGALHPVGQTTFQWRNSGTGFFKNIKKNSYIGCCMVVRKSVLDRILPIPENVWIHDQWIGLLAEKLGSVIFLEDILLSYRRHEENVTGLNHGSVTSMIKKRWNMVREVQKRQKEWEMSALRNKNFSQ